MPPGPLLCTFCCTLCMYIIYMYGHCSPTRPLVRWLWPWNEFCVFCFQERLNVYYVLVGTLKLETGCSVKIVTNGITVDVLTCLLKRLKKIHLHVVNVSSLLTSCLFSFNFHHLFFILINHACTFDHYPRHRT